MGMGERFIGTLVIVMGVVSAWVGIAASASCLRTAGRASRQTEMLYAAMPEGWASWFLGGFSGLTAGIQRLWAIAAFGGWTLAGLCLVSLGLRLIWQ